MDASTRFGTSLFLPAPASADGVALKDVLQVSMVAYAWEHMHGVSKGSASTAVAQTTGRRPRAEIAAMPNSAS